MRWTATDRSNNKNCPPKVEHLPSRGFSGNVRRIFRHVSDMYPAAQNRYMQEKILEELIFARIHVGPVFALVRIQEIFLRNYFRNMYSHFGPALCIDIVPVFAHPWCQYINVFWGGINFGASTCGTCIHTRANTGKYSWLRVVKTVFLENGGFFFFVVPLPKTGGFDEKWRK